MVLERVWVNDAVNVCEALAICVRVEDMDGVLVPLEVDSCVDVRDDVCDEL